MQSKGNPSVLKEPWYQCLKSSVQEMPFLKQVQRNSEPLQEAVTINYSLWFLFIIVRYAQLAVFTCISLASMVIYLAYILYEITWHMNDKKAESICVSEVPRNVADLQVFLGLEKGYEEFLPGCKT